MHTVNLALPVCESAYIVQSRKLVSTTPFECFWVQPPLTQIIYTACYTHAPTNTLIPYCIPSFPFLPEGYFFHPRPCPFCALVSIPSPKAGQLNRTHLLPFLYQGRHLHHSLLPHHKAIAQSPLPQLSLDPLALSRTLDLQASLYPPLLLGARFLDRPGKQIEDIVFLCEFDEVGLLAEAVDGAVPAAGDMVFAREEGVWVREACLGFGWYVARY